MVVLRGARLANRLSRILIMQMDTEPRDPQDRRMMFLDEEAIIEIDKLRLWLGTVQNLTLAEGAQGFPG